MDECVAVTGYIEDKDVNLPCGDWRIGTVVENSLQGKLAAAAEKKIDTVCVTADQVVDAKDIPTSVRLERVKTTKDAYHILDNYQDILDRYREHVRLNFEGRWNEQKTKDPDAGIQTNPV